MISNLEFLGPLGKSDHSVLSFDFNYQTSKPNKIKESKNYNKGDFKTLTQELNAINWNEFFRGKNIDENWKNLLKKLGDLENKFIPVKLIDVEKCCKKKFPIDAKTLE